MGMLGSGPKDPPKIRIKTVLIKGVPPSVKRVPASSVRPPGRPPAATASPGPAGRAGTKSASPLPCSSSDERRESRKRKAAPTSDLPAAAAAKRPMPASPSRGAQRVNFGAESSDEEDDDERWMRVDGVGKKKKKRPHRCEDPDRKLRNISAFEDGAAACAATATSATATSVAAAAGHGADDDGAATFIHAEAVASLALKCEPAIGASENDVSFELQYPSLLARERYQLVAGKDKVDAVADALQVVRHIAETYLTEQQARLLTDPRHGVIRRLEKASNRNINDVAGFRTALGVYNDLLLSLVRAGAVAENLDRREELLPEDLVAFILTQVYDRAVAPQVDLLTKYEPGSDNVYGELLHPLVTRILVDEIGLRSGQVFVDLGSGVGNVVIQAALEIGCESWGCEMMENACNLAERQLGEFRARCALWGIRPGRVRLERGDFRKNEPIQHALKRADAVLVNNQAFTAQLNDDLVRMFLDLKPGCHIISLKSFVRSSCHNINDVGSTILDVRELTYPEGGQVSWTNAGGNYCISTKKK